MYPVENLDPGLLASLEVKETLGKSAEVKLRLILA